MDPSTPSTEHVTPATPPVQSQSTWNDSFNQMDAAADQLRVKMPLAPPGLLNGYMAVIPWVAIVFGVLGVLVKARAKALVPAIAPIIDQLESKANFWIAQPSNGRSCGLQERKADRRQKLAAASRGQERWAVSLSS